MSTYETAEFIHHHTSCFGIALAKDRPFIGYLGIESGGRKRQHLDFNLLRPGLGGVLLPPPSNATPSRAAARRDGDSVVYDRIEHPDGVCACRITFPDERRIVIRFTADRGTLPAELLRLAFAPDRSPMSFWARPRDWNHPKQAPRWDLQNPTPCEVEFDAPGVATFPDFGAMSVEGDRMRIVERLVPDPVNAGLNLGLANAGHHNVRKAFHHGHFDLSFITDNPLSEATLTLRMDEERFPDIAGCDFSGDRWAGLRRLWMNAFTLNPMTLTMGDNPILAGTGHLSIHWKSDMAVFTPRLIEGVALSDFIRNTLERTFVHHTDEHGKMSGYGWENGGCNLIALHDYVLITGDWDFVRRHLPVVRRVIEYNLSLDQDNDGILETAYHGNHFRDEKTSLNWWDAFAFGHKDAYGNLVYHQAFRRARKLLAALNEHELIDRIDTFTDRFRSNFHRTFYNPQTGVYAGWISRDGRMHDYMFTFITAMAINEGLLDGEPARQMLQRLLDALERNGYGAFRFGVPGPAIPVDPEDRTTWGPMGDWGQYENGGFCGQTAYHFILALYRVGMRAQADRILFNMIATFDELPTHSGLNPGFVQSVDWRTRDGQPCGYNYLADNYVFLLAAVQGHFGVDMPSVSAPA